jgi:septal ring factor EnvC (AmiA/AmiB activator)
MDRGEKMSERTSFDIDKERSECDLEVLSAEKARDVIETEIVEKRRKVDLIRVELRDLETEIVEKRRKVDLIRVELRDLDTALIKAKCVCRELKAKKAQLDRDFWSAHHSGI